MRYLLAAPMLALLVQTSEPDYAKVNSRLTGIEHRLTAIERTLSTLNDELGEHSSDGLDQGEVAPFVRALNEVRRALKECGCQP